MAFHPDQISGIFGYWTADNAVLSGGLVSELPDVSRNRRAARSLKRVGTGLTYTASDPTFNRKPSVSSTGTDKRLQATFDVALSQPYTIYQVVNQAAGAIAENSFYWRSNAGNLTNSAGFYVYDGAPVIQNHDAGNAVTAGSALSGQAHVTCCVYNGSASYIYVDDSQAAFAGPSDGLVDSDTCTVMTVGSFGTSVSYSWTTLIAYSGSHDAHTRRRVMRWLGMKYGVAVDNPVYSDQFDPATLNLSGWWRAPYTAPGADPRWTGTASAGSSSGRTLVQGYDVDAVPGTGTAVNGYTPADFVGGSGHSLDTNDAASSLVSTGAGSVALLAYVASTAATNGDGFLDGALICDRNNCFAITFSTSGARVEFYDGANKAITPIACSTGAWHLIQAKWNGTNLYGRVDNGSWQSIACGASATFSLAFAFAKLPYVAFHDLRLLDAFFAQSALSDGDFDNIRSYCNSRYGLSV